MSLSLDDIRRRYREMSLTEFSSIQRDDLTPEAQEVYDLERARRGDAIADSNETPPPGELARAATRGAGCVRVIAKGILILTIIILITAGVQYALERWLKIDDTSASAIGLGTAIAAYYLYSKWMKRRKAPAVSDEF